MHCKDGSKRSSSGNFTRRDGRWRPDGIRHGRRSLGCLEPKCPLCTQNPNRRCSSSFSNKYLSGDVLKAKCGASIRVQVIDRATLEPVKGSVTDNIFLEVRGAEGASHCLSGGRETQRSLNPCSLRVARRGVVVCSLLGVATTPCSEGLATTTGLYRLLHTPQDSWEAPQIASPFGR